jgi:hypothetical protein
MNEIQAALAEKMEQVVWHGEYFSAICPFPHHGHKESHPSMLVFADGFNCRGCGKSGKLRYLLSQISKSSSLLETVKVSKPSILPKWRKWANKYGDIPSIADAGHRLLINIKGHGSFFRARKIDQFIKQGHFGWLDGWALFPVFDQDGKIIDIVVRATKGKGTTKYVVHADKGRMTPNIYVPNWKRVLEADTVYVVYGMIDAWALEEIGLPAITGTTGQSLSPLKLKPLQKKMIIIPDRYEEDAAYKLANQIGWRARVQRIKWPSEIKDCDEIRMKFGNEILRDCIQDGFSINIVNGQSFQI